MKSRYIFIIALIFALTSIVALRFNNKKALVLASQIQNKDALSVDVKTDIAKLQQFVIKHMNSSVKVELSASYERAVTKAKAGNVDINGDLYAQAQAECDRQGIGSVAQAQCVKQYLDARVSPGTNTQPVVLPERSSFIYSFAAPNWTPDIAGFSLVACVLFGLGAIAIYIYNLFRTQSS